MWYCKMYFPGRHEVIESDAFGTQGAPSQRKVFPFLESLLSFTELDTGKVAVALRCISDDLESLDRERMTNAMVRLGALAEMHSFFRVLYTKWFYFRSVGFENTEAFRWLCAHAEEYGFILRYPKDAEAVTEITYEPWHWRYVGPENAALINQSGLCFEDAVALLKKLAAGESVTG